MSNNIIKTLNSLIELSCEIQSINVPYIYYVHYNNKKVVLRDKSFNVISYDIRDVVYNVKTIKFIPKENVIYINTDVLNDKILSYSLALRETRYMFHIHEITSLKDKNITLTDTYLIKQWKYCYDNTKINKKYYINSPVEIDKNAYSYIIMKTVFNINLRFDGIDNELFTSTMDVLNKIYNPAFILHTSSKYDIYNVYYDLKYFQ